MEQAAPFPSRVTIEQGTATPEAWVAFLRTADEIGTRILHHATTERPETAPPLYLSQGDFVNLAGNDRALQRLATRAWMTTLVVRRTGGFQFQPEEGARIRTGGLVFSPFVERVRIMQAEMSNGSSVALATQKHLGRAVAADRFGFWVRVADHFSPSENTEQ